MRTQSYHLGSGRLTQELLESIKDKGNVGMLCAKMHRKGSVIAVCDALNNYKKQGTLSKPLTPWAYKRRKRLCVLGIPPIYKFKNEFVVFRPSYFLFGRPKTMESPRLQLADDNLG